MKPPSLIRRFASRPVRLAVWLLLGGSLAIAAPGGDDALPSAAPKRYSKGVLIRFEGPITSMNERYLMRHLDAALAKRADLVIVEFDSPGGYLHESLNMAERLQGTAAHTVAYIPREALSGAAIAALGCDEIVMGEHARLGDAGAIFQGEDALFRHAPEKIRSDLARRVRDLAEAKGRAPALAEAMVDMDLLVYHVRHAESGEERLLSDKEIAALADAEQWKKGRTVLESGNKQFLEVNGKTAVELKLAQAVVASRDELRSRYPADDFRIVSPGWLDLTVYILNLPLVTIALIVVGLVALYIEFSAPGIGMGGVTAGLCFALFFWSRFLGGTADWLEVILFVAGGVCLGIEIFVTPGFGVMGIAGLLLMFLGVVLASQNFVIPKTGRELNTLAGSLAMTLGSGVGFTISAVIISRYFGSIPVFNKLVLKPPPADEEKSQSPGGRIDKKGIPEQSGGVADVHVGDWGVTTSLLRPAGKARFADRYLDVVTDGSFVSVGKQVRVIEISGNRIMVSEVE